MENQRVKNGVASTQRKFVQEGSKRNVPVLAIGDKGTGVGSTIKGYARRGGKWLQNLHGRYTITAITDEYLTSQLCIYCYCHITHPINKDGSKSLGIARCLNPDCIAFRVGRAINNRDQMSTAIIGMKAMITLFFHVNFTPSTPPNRLQS